MEIVLTRIDDRLIHGQVMTAWVGNVKGNKIVIVDDEVGQDPFMQNILKMMAPSGIEIQVFTVEGAIEELTKEGNADDRIIILVKTPEPVYELIKAGVAIKELNIGGMGSKAGRKNLYRNIHASPEERETIRKIIEKGVNAIVRIVPDDRGVDVQRYL